ncbi:hypothetical protein FPV67DRAFT_1390185, partial [Lyophyllum atratum]
YEESPMAELRRELESEDDDEMSINTAVSIFVSKKSLGESDVVDRGITLRSPVPRFTIRSGLLSELDTAIPHFQDCLRRASELSEERSSNFKIDPRGVLLSILKGTNELGQLNAAWTGLRRRIELAVINFEKYDAQYQNRLAITSPASTAIELYDGLDKLTTDSDKLRYPYDTVPHFQEQLDKDSKGKTKSFRKWEELIPLSAKLKDSFPVRKAEL